MQRELLAPPSAYRAGTPAAIVIRATWPDETVVRTTVGHLAEDLRATGTTLTVLVLIGDFLDAGAHRSHLYSPDFAHTYRKRSLAGTTAGRPAGRSRPS